MFQPNCISSGVQVGLIMWTLQDNCYYRGRFSVVTALQPYPGSFLQFRWWNFFLISVCGSFKRVCLLYQMHPAWWSAILFLHSQVSHSNCCVSIQRWGTIMKKNVKALRMLSDLLDWNWIFCSTLGFNLIFVRLMSLSMRVSVAVYLQEKNIGFYDWQFWSHINFWRFEYLLSYLTIPFQLTSRDCIKWLRK
jgi:hypothetical protein